MFDSSVTVRDDAYFLPRFGYRFHMPKEFEKMKYFGRGPTESYIDKQQATKQGLFECTVTEHFESYVRPQENMAHVDTAFLEIRTKNGEGVLANGTEKSPRFSFNCSRFTTEQLTEAKHTYELCPFDETVVHIDYKQSGIGSNSCGPRLDDRYRMTDKRLRFSFQLTSVR